MEDAIIIIKDPVLERATLWLGFVTYWTAKEALLLDEEKSVYY
jgi:hypothetical protein